MHDNEKNIGYILKHLYLIAVSIEQICDDILSSRILMSRVMDFRYLYLDLYLWRGYLSRLLDTELKDFAKQLLFDFSQNIYKDIDKINKFRNRATHYNENCDMDIKLTIKEGDKYPMPDLPSYKDIKKYFQSWEKQILSKMAECSEM